MNELRHQINTQLKASGVSQGIQYKSYSNNQMNGEPLNKNYSYNSSNKVSNKNISSLKSSKIAINQKKRSEAEHLMRSQVETQTNESLQMKINKKRIQSSNKQVDGQSQPLAQSQVVGPGHHRIVSNPINFNHDNLGQAQSIGNKSRKNLSSQQSQSKLRAFDNSSENNQNPTQQILKLRAQALVPPQSMMMKNNDKDLRVSTQVGFGTGQNSKIQKREARQNQQKMAQILAMDNNAPGQINNQQLAAQIMLGGLNTINNEVNSRQEVHEHNIGNPVGPNKKGNHSKAFSMSSYVLQKQVPKTQQLVAQEQKISSKIKGNTNQAPMTLHQKSQSTFNGQQVFAGGNTYDARKTYQNNNQVNVHPQAFSSSMAKLIQNNQNNTVGANNVPTKKKVLKPGHQIAYAQRTYQKQVHGNTVNGSIQHNLHRRIMSQQNPLQEQAQNNIEQYIQHQQEMQNPPQINSSGKIVVINNNNTNINIHHQSPYQGSHTQYPQMVKQPQMHHKKNTQSFNIPSTHNQDIRTPGHQSEPKNTPGIHGGKAYTYVNSTIKNSINNSINQGLLSHDQLNNFAINNYVGDEELISNQLSPQDKNPIPKQKNFKNSTTNIQNSVYSNTQSRKSTIKRGKIDTRLKGSTAGYAETNPSVLSGGIMPTQGSNTNIKYSVQSQMQMSQQQKQMYNPPGAITSVGSASSIGPADKIERVEEKGVKGKTRQPSQNKSATRGKSSHIGSKDIIEPRHQNQNSSSAMRKTMKNINVQKKQDQVQMHQGDISSSNFLNSERSSINQKKSTHIQPVSKTQKQSTIQYQNHPHSQANQQNYLQMYHNTEDNRRQTSGQGLTEQSILMPQGVNHQQYIENQNSLSQDHLAQNLTQFGRKQQNHQIQDQYFNVVNNSIINTQGATRGINHQKIQSHSQNKDSLSNGQKNLQKMLNQNINKLSPSQQFKNTNTKTTNTTKSHQRQSSVNIPNEYTKPSSNHGKGVKKLIGHRKVESHDQAVLEQMKNNPNNYYVNKNIRETDIQSYNNFDKYSNSENIKSDKYRRQRKEESGHTQNSQLSNRQKIMNLDKSVPVSEISLHGTIAEVPHDIKNIQKMQNSPTKQQFPMNSSNNSSPHKKGSPKMKTAASFFKKTVIQSESSNKDQTPKKTNVKMSTASQIHSGALTPKKLIYNSILSNIAANIYDTKIEYYKIGKVIGKGAFGKVNLAIHRLTGKFVALKSINKTFMKDENSLKKVRQEYNILKRARHPNIVRLYESFEIESHIVYVMEVCGGGDLLTYVRRRRKLKEEYAKFIFRQIIKGLQYVHHKGVLHRDIKLDNILLTSEGDVKICDFGVSKLVPNKNQTQTEQCGTPAYIAPEVFKGKGYKGFQSDVWSAGVVLYAMLYGTVPFKATNMHELQAQIINLQCSWGSPGEVSPQALEMLKKVLEVDPAKRLTPAEILNEPWMQLTDKQLEEIQVFTENEKQKIISEFLYYNEKKEDMKDDPFLEQEILTTQNSEYKNNTTKSIILAPFNSTRSHISDDYLVNEGILPLIVNKESLVFADKCKEVNRQYMLNNNAELDNGVYNENEEEDAAKAEAEKQEQAQKDDGLLGMNMQIENKNPAITHSGSPSQPRSKIESQHMTANASLNTSQVILDEDKIEKVCDMFGYQFEYIKEQLDNDELNHATTCYFLIDQEKEF